MEYIFRDIRDQLLSIITGIQKAIKFDLLFPLQPESTVEIPRSKWVRLFASNRSLREEVASLTGANQELRRENQDIKDDFAAERKENERLKRYIRSLELELSQKTRRR